MACPRGGADATAAGSSEPKTTVSSDVRLSYLTHSVNPPESAVRCAPVQRVPSMRLAILLSFVWLVLAAFPDGAAAQNAPDEQASPSEAKAPLVESETSAPGSRKTPEEAEEREGAKPGENSERQGKPEEKQPSRRSIFEEIPKAFKNFPGTVERAQEEFQEDFRDFVNGVPFPGAPPPEKRPKGWAREFFLEVPSNQIQEAEGLGLVPQIGFSEETQFKGGLQFAYGGLFEEGDRLSVGAAGTSREQFITDVEYISREALADNARFELAVDVAKWVEFFYGLGNEASQSAEDQFDVNFYRVSTSVWGKLPENFRVGWLFHASGYAPDEDTYDQFGPLNPLFPGQRPTGFTGGRLLGMGGGIAFDSRDNEFFPNQGYLVEARILRFDEGIGSEFSYTRYNIDTRAFFTPKLVGHVFAFRALLMGTAWGDVPFFAAPALGGSGVGRGFISGRFRDEVAVAVQSEYRFSIYGRISAAVYADFIQVAPDLSEIRFEEFHLSGGAALGYLIPPGKVLLVRFELAGSEDGVSAFLRFGHPF